MSPAGSERGERVVLHLLDGGCRQAQAQAVEVVLVCVELELLGGAQAVEAEVLEQAGVGGVLEGVRQGVLRRDAAPDGVLHEREVAVDGVAVLVALLAVLEDVLADLSEVEVQVAAVGVVGLGVEERVEHPELEVFYVGVVEVGVVHLAHDSAPALLGAEEQAVGGDVLGVEVVRAALGRVEGEVEGLYVRALAVRLVSAGEYLLDGDLADVGAGELLEVVLEVAGEHGGIALGEDAVDGVPCQQGAVLAVGDVVAEPGLGE